jgi:small GTP-binding protein
MAEQVHRRNCKAVLLGNSGVGKTSLTMQWVTGNHQALTGSTIGPNHQRRTINLEKEDIDLFVWDTAGQERFRVLTPLYAHSAAAALIVVAVNDPDSFKDIPLWTDLLSSSCDKQPPMILAVNKIDRSEPPCMDRDAIKEKYEGSFKSIFYVSALTGEGVHDVFHQLGECAYEFMIENDMITKPHIHIEAVPENRCC